MQEPGTEISYFTNTRDPTETFSARLFLFAAARYLPSDDTLASLIMLLSFWTPLPSDWTVRRDAEVKFGGCVAKFTTYWETPALLWTAKFMCDWHSPRRTGHLSG